MMNTLLDATPQTILCATRGGPASYPAQDAAIALAQEQGHDIVFVFVSDVEFVDMVTSAVLVDMEEQMTELGEFLLLMAQERAHAAGVKAMAEVRSGRFRDALVAVSRAYNVSTIVLGRPGERGSRTKHEYLDELSRFLEEETGAGVVIV